MTVRFGCVKCGAMAVWCVWYQDCTLAVGGANIAYNHLCDEHLIAAIRGQAEGTDEYPVSQVTRLKQAIVARG